MKSKGTEDFLSMLDLSHRVTNDEKKMVLNVDDSISLKDSVKHLMLAVFCNCMISFALGTVISAAYYGGVDVVKSFLIVVLTGLLGIVLYNEFNPRNKRLFSARYAYMLKYDMYKYEAEVDEALKVPTGKGVNYYLALRFKDMSVVSSFISVPCEYYYCDYGKFDWDLYTIILPNSSPLFFVKRREIQVA